MKINTHSSSQDHLVAIRLPPSINTNNINIELTIIIRVASYYNTKKIVRGFVRTYSHSEFEY